MNARILIVEDETALAQMLAMHFEDEGHEVFHASCLREARELEPRHQPDLILMDQGLPDGKGYDLLCEFQEQDSPATMIMMTAEHDLDLAIAAIKAGAFDFVHKPIKTDELNHTVNRALEHQKLARQVEVLSSVTDVDLSEPRLLGKSQAMLDVSKEIALVAGSNARVLITGESGTGKELVARAIHHHSQRPGPFLAINCAALVDNLLESELFGHERGAFTGATDRKPGKFELAENGTLFLDEIGEMALPLQAKLLRVLQEGTFERLGGSQTLRSNARVIAATNRSLPDEIEQGNFREDLYYRLNAMQIALPPLRERAEDIPTLVEGLLERVCRSEGKTNLQTTPEAMAFLKHYPWPGNIRELQNVLTQAVIRARSNYIGVAELCIANSEQSPSNPYTSSQPTGSSTNPARDANEQPMTLADLEAKHIQYVLDFTGGHKGKTASILDISRPALDRKIEKYQLTVK
jgi:two-component system response regulator AtoC